VRRVLLTDEFISRLPATAENYALHHDAEVQGFCVVYRRGHWVWRVYRPDGWFRGRGSCNEQTLAKATELRADVARVIAQDWISDASIGLDPRKTSLKKKLARANAKLEQARIEIEQAKYDALPKDMRLHLRSLENEASKRATKSGFAYDLPYRYAEVLFVAQNGACALTELPMDLAKQDGAFRRPWAPSLDRIDNDKGYVKDNVRLVCVAANYAKGEWSENVFRKLVTAAARNPFL
jgi:hypothetical protein